MLKAVLFAGENTSCVALETLAIESKQVSFLRTLRYFPQAYELTKILNSIVPDLVFLDLEEWDNALAAAHDIQSIAPSAAIVGFGAGWGTRKEEQCHAAGIAEMLISPVTLQTFEACVEHAILKARDSSQDNLFAFLPAKAGCGCSTIALNSAGYLAGFSGKDPVGRKVLLIESDLHSGVLSLVLGAEHRFSVLDALEQAAELDSSNWARCVAQSGGVDILLSNRTRPPVLPTWVDYYHLLDFAAPRYDTILVDLPEVVNDATVEIVRRAKRVFVVCTPETAPLALALQRCHELEKRGIPAVKIRVLVNRWQSGQLDAKQVQELLSCPVSAVFGNDYLKVCDAARRHTFVDAGTKLGRSYASFARMLAGTPDTGGGSMRAFFKALGAKPEPEPQL